MIHMKVRGQQVPCKLLAASVIAGLLQLPALAQPQAITGDLASVGGIVSDSSGARLSGAAAALRCSFPRFEATTKTDEAGSYRFNGVPRGSQASICLSRLRHTLSHKP